MSHKVAMHAIDLMTKDVILPSKPTRRTARRGDRAGSADRHGARPREGETMAVSSTTAKPHVARQSGVPPLENGDRLTRDEFERRYEAMPHLKKAELIEGVVYVPSPVRRHHGAPHAHLIGWLGQYAAGTPGVEVSDNSTVRLDLDNEPNRMRCCSLTRPVGARRASVPMITSRLWNWSPKSRSAR